MLISIIITAYNVEDYIEQSIKSALNQKLTIDGYSDFTTEVIVVDDFSTDKTRDIINNIYNEYHGNFKIINSSTKNSGSGISRKAGISIAKGDYLILLDGDDWLEEDYLSKLVAVAYKTNADIISGGIIVNKPNNAVETYTYGDFELTGDDKVTRFFGEKIVFMNNKIIKKHLHDKVPYCTRRFIEDTQVIIPQLYLANKVVYVNCAGYHYRMNEKSLTHKASALKYNVYRALCLKDLMEFFKDKPKGGWCDIINFQQLMILISNVVTSTVTLDDIKNFGTNALEDWAEFSLLAFEAITLNAKYNIKNNS